MAKINFDSTCITYKLIPVFLCLYTITSFADTIQIRQDNDLNNNRADILIATGSPGELGLIDALIKAYIEDEPTTIGWIKAGSGKSLQLLKQGVVDIALVHAPEAEKNAMKQGWATQRQLIGANEFYLVGPKDDPANIHNASSIADAYKRIFDRQAPFISRGDNSGTHKREQQIWQSINITPTGDWYHKSNSFMLNSLKQANIMKAYFMTDSSTWLASHSKLNNLDILFKGDTDDLINHYHALLGRHPSRKCQQFFQFLSDFKAQTIISNFGNSRHGKALYLNAEKAKRNDKQ